MTRAVPLPLPPQGGKEEASGSAGGGSPQEERQRGGWGCLPTVGWVSAAEVLVVPAQQHIAHR